MAGVIRSRGKERVMADIDIEQLRASARLEVDSVMKDKSEDYKEGFNVGCEFMLDYVNELLEAYGLKSKEGLKD